MDDIKGVKNKNLCASCRYQRRRCSKDCPFAPYFPSDKQQMFINVHRLFRLSYLKKILRYVTADEKDDAIKSIIFESDIRARFRSHGCLGIIWYYQHKIQESLQELNYLKMLIASCKQN